MPAKSTTASLLSILYVTVDVFDNTPKLVFLSITTNVIIGIEWEHC
jgi:hypothetical protein